MSMSPLDEEIRCQYLDAIGVQVWRSRQADVGDVITDTKTEVDSRDSFLSWEELEAKVANCHSCELSKQRTQTVFGVGNKESDWMIIGEAPGVDEDKQGEPFVGRAGKLLNQMLLSIGLKREAVYIGNIVKCRPPQNRDPKPEEVACCESYLKQQIALLKPRVILALGRVAAHNLLKTDIPLGKMRGQDYEYADSGIPVVVTYHPAYLLRSPQEKRKAWEDLLRARKIISNPC